MCLASCVVLGVEYTWLDIKPVIQLLVSAIRRDHKNSRVYVQKLYYPSWPKRLFNSTNYNYV